MALGISRVCGWVLCGVTLVSVGCSKEQAAAPQARAANVSALTVKAQTVPVTFQFVGQTESSQQVEIRARVSGFLDKRVYREGSRVEQGQVLFQIDPKPFAADLQAAQGELAQQQARLKTARANLARVKPLVADNALAAKDLDDATGQEQAAAAAVESAKARVVDAQLKLGYTTITSPLDGLSSFAKVQEGAYVGPANSLLTYVARLDPIRVNFSLSENETLRMRDEIAKGSLVGAANDNYPVELLLADGSVFPARGRITFADASFSEETGTFLLRAELPNPKGDLRPGQFVRVNVLGPTRPNAIVVPQRAVQEGPRGQFVWLVDAEGKALQRPVTAGDWLGDQWLVSQGLKDGERVIVDGFMRLAPGMPVQVKDVPAEPMPNTASTAPSVAGAGGPTPAPSSPAPLPATTPAAPSASATAPSAFAVGREAVYFDVNRARVDATGQAVLGQIAAAMRAQPALRASLHGYVDNTGSSKRNQELAKQRARAVRDALVAAGVPAQRIALEKPADITGGQGPAQARRVDVVLVGAR